MLHDISVSFYDTFTTVSVDVDQFSYWSNKFVPKEYSSITVGEFLRNLIVG